MTKILGVFGVDRHGVTRSMKVNEEYDSITIDILNDIRDSFGYESMIIDGEAEPISIYTSRFCYEWFGSYWIAEYRYAVGMTDGDNFSNFEKYRSEIPDGIDEIRFGWDGFPWTTTRLIPLTY